MHVHNTSGRGHASRVPPEIQRWNWGAFLLNWIWGIGNTAPAAFLTLVPFVGFIWVFVVGARGNEWAWRNRRWDSVAQFEAVQRRWAWWGFAVWACAITLFTLLFVFVYGALADSPAYQLAQARLTADPHVAAIVGRPMSMGLPSGEIDESAPGASARLSFSVEGPRSEGSAFVTAHMEQGVWKIDRLMFEENGSGNRIELAVPAQEQASAPAP